MSSKRTVLSRPRTRLYDASYNIGQSLYKPTLDQLDRKYSGRPLSPPRQLFVPSETMERLNKSMFDDELGSGRRRGETFFDSRGARIDPHGIDLFDNFENETVSRVKSVTASKRITHVDDAEMEGAVSSLNSRRLLDRSDKILETMGITEGPRRGIDEDFTMKRRSVRIAEDEDVPVTSSRPSTRWTALKQTVDIEEDKESPAVMRAKQSKARLDDLDEEMEAMAERQAAREKRAARLRAILAECENDDLSEPVADVIERKSVRYQEAEV